jgi:REP element-mobilizing transposase RayT
VKLLKTNIVIVIIKNLYDTMRNRVCQNHITLQLKLKKNHIQLLCNYPPKNMVY